MTWMLGLRRWDEYVFAQRAIVMPSVSFLASETFKGKV